LGGAAAAPQPPHDRALAVERTDFGMAGTGEVGSSR
jgi:hypothetical protein